MEAFGLWYEGHGVGLRALGAQGFEVGTSDGTGLVLRPLKKGMSSSGHDAGVPHTRFGHPSLAKKRPKSKPRGLDSRVAEVVRKAADVRTGNSSCTLNAELNKPNP